MNIFKRDNTTELRDQIGELEARNLTLKEECAEYRRTITGFVNVKASYEAEKEKLMALHKNELTQLKQQIEIEKKSVAKKVNAELASIGVSQFVPEEISSGSPLQSPEAILEQFTSMPESPEKHEFFKLHEKIISKAMKTKTSV